MFGIELGEAPVGVSRQPGFGGLLIEGQVQSGFNGQGGGFMGDRLDRSGDPSA